MLSLHQHYSYYTNIRNNTVNYLTVENLKKSYGEIVLFEDINFAITEGQKIALIAKNGTGKTSMLNILAGLDESDGGGTVTKAKDCSLGFLPQLPLLDEQLTIEETIFATNSPLLQIIKDYEYALANPQDEIAYQKAFEQMDKNDTWIFEQRYKQILSQLKITNTQQPITTLSGGQKKRVALAHILVLKPDILLLDEPTNHLDLEMIEWLEQYLEKEKTTLFMVTHDRYFLECVCNEIWELDEKQLFQYKGNYSYYLEKKEERLQQKDTEVEKAQNLYKKELEWMRRQPKARGTKSKSRIQDFYETKKTAHYTRDTQTVKLDIEMQRLGKKIIEFQNVSKQFDSLIILDNFSYNFQRKERLGIVGNNGTGKSTFLNLLTQKEHVDNGEIIIGETIRFGYYTQQGINIKPQQKVLEVIKEIADYIPMSKGRQLSAESLLERFLFSRKQQHDLVEKLSGGEQKRLYLCRVLMTNPNFLIMDEPTNDLDIITLNILEDFLMQYEGCLIVVSHDRYFMDKMVDHLFVFKGNGNVQDFPGNYSQYRIAEKGAKKQSTKSPKAPIKRTAKPKTKLSYNEQKEYDTLLTEIHELENKKIHIEAKFNTLSSPEEIAQNAKEYETLSHEIDTKTERWMELELLLESFNS